MHSFGKNYIGKNHLNCDHFMSTTRRNVTTYAQRLGGEVLNMSLSYTVALCIYSTSRRVINNPKVL